MATRPAVCRAVRSARRKIIRFNFRFYALKISGQILFRLLYGEYRVQYEKLPCTDTSVPYSEGILYGYMRPVHESGRAHNGNAEHRRDAEKSAPAPNNGREDLGRSLVCHALSCAGDMCEDSQRRRPIVGALSPQPSTSIARRGGSRATTTVAARSDARRTSPPSTPSKERVSSRR